MKFGVILFLLFLYSNLYADNTILFNLKNGENIQMLLSTKPVITYTADSIKVNCDNMLVVIAMDEVEDLRFGDEEGLGINQINNSEKLYQIHNGYIYLENIPDGEYMYLCNIDGKIIESHKVNNGGCSSLNLNKYPKGIYIVKSNTFCFKLYR